MEKEELVLKLSTAHKQNSKDPVTLCFAPPDHFVGHPNFSYSKLQDALFKECHKIGEPWTRSG